MLARLRNFFGFERRDVGASDPYLAEYLNLRGTMGQAVSPDAALSASSVAHRCVTLLSELSASVPLRLYRRMEDGGRELAREMPLYAVLHDMANDNQSAFEAREFLVRSLLLHGNGYARLERNARGQVTAMFPLQAITVGIERLPSGRLRYRVTEPRGGGYVLLQEEMLHLRGPSRDGIIGLSPLQIARGSMALAVNQAETAYGLMERAVKPSGVVSYPDKLPQVRKDEVRSKIAEKHAGPQGAGNVLVLDGGAKWEGYKHTSVDMEFLASRKLSNEDVARLFGVPPSTVGITDKSTWSNVEQEARALVQNALGPLASRIEASIYRCCLTDAGRRIYYPEHDLTGLLRGDVEARFKAYKAGREIGVFSANDILRRENEPAIGPEGDVRYVPANWMKLGENAPNAAPSAPPAAGG
jgi:HK97 family phage portal protein